MWLLVTCNNIHVKIWVALFLFYVSPRTVCHSSLFPPTNDNLDQDGWQVNIDGWKLAWLSKTEAFCHLSFQLYMFSTAVSERNTIVTANKIPFLIIWVLVKESVATVVSSMAVFVRTFMQAFTAE